MKCLRYVLLACAVGWCVAAFAEEDELDPGRPAATPTPLASAALEPDVWTPLHGTAPGLEPRRSPAVRSSPSAVRVSPSEPPADLSDPWAAERAKPGLPYRPTLRRVARMRIADDGTLVWKTFDLDVGAGGGAIPAVVYDLSGMSPEWVTLGEALVGEGWMRAEPLSERGLAPAPGEAATWVAWWQRLGGAVLERMGRQHWDDARHVIAWNRSKDRLYVRLESAALDVLEEVLDEFAGCSVRVVPVHVEVTRAGERTTAFDLDVPWHRPVRACRGLGTSFVCDYDLECDNSTVQVDPIITRLETGIGVAANRLDTPAGLGAEILVRVAIAPGTPRFVSERVSLLPHWTRAVTLELPANTCAYWQGRLAAEPGIHAVRLPGGATCRITVGEERGLSEEPVRPWRRVPTEQAGAGERTREFLCTVELVGTRSETLGSHVLALGGSACAGSVALRPAAVFPATAAQRSAGLALASDPALGGGIVLHAATVGAWDAPSALDVTLEGGRVTGVVRGFDVEYIERDGTQGAARLRFPEVALHVLSRRVELDAAGCGSLRFDADLGRGPERWTLLVRRSVPRR